ncbi:hypothetical protein B4135_2812 [Caldibacillus debilis]|uniref:Uncharacterized protein n=1 Tax=Caldibacillus debilis TaxID=301148 RepID=A0A150LQ23_9BACI|nr:hypothetical protein B4135_2812 [Caldibacillus debilis]
MKIRREKSYNIIKNIINNIGFPSRRIKLLLEPFIFDTGWAKIKDRE